MAGQQFVGTWERVKTQDMEAFLEVIGVPEEFRKVAAEQKETLVIENEGDVVRVKVVMEGGLEDTSVFTVGQECEWMTMMGKPVKGTMHEFGEKMVETQYLDGNKLDIVRELVNGQLQVTTKCNGKMCTVWFDRK